MVDISETLAGFSEALNVLGAVASDDAYRDICLRTTAVEREQALRDAVDTLISCQTVFGDDVKGFVKALPVLESMQTALQRGGLDESVRALAGDVVNAFKP